MKAGGDLDAAAASPADYKAEPVTILAVMPAVDLSSPEVLPAERDGRGTCGVVRALGSGEVPVVRGDEPDAQHGGERVEFEGGAQVGEGLGFDAGAQDGGVGVVVCGD
jgi:hypothetical protein